MSVTDFEKYHKKVNVMENVAAEVNHQLKQMTELKGAKDRLLLKSKLAFLHSWVQQMQNQHFLSEMMHDQFMRRTLFGDNSTNTMSATMNNASKLSLGDNTFFMTKRRTLNQITPLISPENSIT
jgi:hypothetical protein